MIPRYQRVLFWILVGGISLMAAFLIHGCRQARKRLALNDATPIAAPLSATTEDVTLYIANDADGTVLPFTTQLALPEEPTTRARVLLDHLIAQYALPAAAHPLQSGPAVDDVFLLADPANPGRIAVINLRGSFVQNHPSGVEIENLTLLSIIGTLHGTFRDVTHIRFLVDGQPHDTLAGHASLSRDYPAADTTTKPTPPEPPTYPDPTNP